MTTGPRDKYGMIDMPDYRTKNYLEAVMEEAHRRHLTAQEILHCLSVFADIVQETALDSYSGEYHRQLKVKM